MNSVQRIGVIIATTGMVAVLVASGAQTANVTKAFFGGLSSWEKTAQGRG
jgi:hypothetical protein